MSEEANVVDRSSSEPTPTTTETHPLPDAIDDEGNEFFGMLIMGELRKMTRVEQKAFKRDVTKLLFE